jgi:SAM-dependent methyltransferase
MRTETTPDPAARSPEAPCCPLCGGGTFVDVRNRKGERCKDCGALVRTRAAWLLLTEVCRVGPGSRVLHFAPEPVLAQRLHALCGDGYMPHDLDNQRYRFDFEVRRCDLCRDIDSLFEKASFDVVMHNHVIEHLPCNYTIVLQKLHALLKPGGHHVFSFPVAGSGRYRCDLSPEMSEQERTQRFRQKDHLRLFAREDFDQTLGMVFDLKDYSLANFIPEARLRRAQILPPRWTIERGPVFIVKKDPADSPS